MVADADNLDAPAVQIATMMEKITQGRAQQAGEKQLPNSFFVLRSSCELHGSSLLMTFLIAHADAGEVVGKAAFGSPRNAGAARRQTQAEYGMEHLIMGCSDLKPIGANDLTALANFLKNGFDRRLYCVIDPISYNLGPLGTPMHDMQALTVAQENLDHTVEYRFFLNAMNYTLFQQLVDKVSQHQVSLISARLDERAFCQINLCLSGSSLKNDDKLIGDFQASMKTCGVTGTIEAGASGAEHYNQSSKRTIQVGGASALLQNSVGQAGV